MNLLQYEFAEGQDNSYNKLIGQLVQNVRYYTSKVPAEQFKAAVPSLQQLERTIQKIDQSVGQPLRNYIQEITDELNKEGDIESNLLEQITLSATSIIEDILKSQFSIGNYLFQYRANKAIYWLNFFGYKDERETDLELILTKEVFRSICIKYGVIFLDFPKT